MANDGKVPRKYWWVVAVAVPVTLALIAIVPSVFKSSGGSGGGPSTAITGDNNTVSFDYSTHNTFVTNVNVIAREYELLTGRPLGDDLRRQIEAAVERRDAEQPHREYPAARTSGSSSAGSSHLQQPRRRIREDTECRRVAPGVRAVEGEDSPKWRRPQRRIVRFRTPR